MRSPRNLSGALAPVLALAMAGTSAIAQTSVATDPVGFVTETVKGGSVSAPQISMISPTLMQPVEWQGPIFTVSGTAITVTGTPWTAGQFGTNGQYFVEVVSGANAGAWTDIEASTSGGLTTLDSLSAFASNGSTIRIRKHVTLNGFFGATNSAGLKGATTQADADEVYVYDGSSSASFWYYDASDAAGPAGWYDSSFHAAGTTVISPNQGVAIRRKTAGNVSFLSMGTVKTGNTFIAVRPGLNILGTASAKPVTLSTSGLYTGSISTGLKGATNQADADEVFIYSATGQQSYWYYDASDAAGPAGWYDSSFHAAGTIAIAPGSSFVVRRKSPGVAFNWPLPSPTTF
jgi:hypothetical protein